jgi:uncharacterized membrane protein (UPF0127 family)
MFNNSTDIKIKTADGIKNYKVVIAETEEERSKGLSGIKKMPEDEGMLFDMPEGMNNTSFTMADMLFPLDIVFFNDDLVAFQVVQADAGDMDPVEASSKNGISYVLEVNINSGIEPGDSLELDFEDQDGSEDSEEDDLDEVDENDEDVKMYVLDPEGNPIMDLFGGERIVSRKETLTLIKKAKVADREKSDAKYKSLGKYLFKVFDGQDGRDEEYVSGPNKNGEN